MFTNKKLFILLLLFFTSILHPQKDAITKTSNTPQEDKKIQSDKKKFTFNFSNKPLIELINELASEKQINIILPQGTAAIAPTTQITIHIADPLPLDQAWNQLQSILDLAGYTMEPERDMIIIRKIDQNISRDPLQLYIDVPLEKIPDTDQVIKAIFYLQNINLRTSWTNLSDIFKDMLSPFANTIADHKTNAIIITDKANNIKSVMKIILELDRGGIRDSIEVLPLYYTSAHIVDDLLNKNLLAPKQSQPTSGTPEQISFFPKNTKVLGLERTNSLVIMGSKQGIGLVKDFILKYIDRPLESGKSILHLYDLQYLNAETFAPILQQILMPAQADQATGSATRGAKQYFKDVIVQAELTRRAEAITTSGQSSAAPAGAQVGGNRLIIAAHHKDWLRIKKLIEDLDKPTKQVAINALIIDVTLDSNQIIANQMRNKEGFNQSISNDVNWQSAQISSPIINSASPTPGNALMSNLLQIGAPFTSGNLASNMTPGSLVFSLNDSQSNGVWSIWQILNMYTNTTLLAQPFLITQNHKQASVTISQQLFLAGTANTANVAVAIPSEWVTAAITVDILPHISGSNNINLNVVININQFIDLADYNRTTRIVQTNANVGDGEILAIGGLTQIQEVISKSEVPILGQIPILGWFFKNKQKTKEKTNLLILISPKIIEPQVNSCGVDPFTDQHLAFAKDDIDEHLSFENLHDPITRWFFKPDPCMSGEIIESYKEYGNVAINQSPLAEGKKEQSKPMTAKAKVNKKVEPITTIVTAKESETLKKLVQNEDNPLTSPKGQALVGLQ